MTDRLPEVEIEKLRKVTWGIVANAGRLSSRAKPRWAHVSDATGQGSTVSRQLCADHGFDPEEVVGGAK